MIYGQVRKMLGEMFHELGAHKEAEIVEGHLRLDHVHMCLRIPPKYAVSNVVGYLKGKSAIMIARFFVGKERNFIGENFWARGYFVSTVGLDEATVVEYSVANYDLYMTQAKLTFVIINHKLMIKNAIECIVLN